MIDDIASLGAWALARLAGLGYGFRFLMRLTWRSVLSLGRPRLIIEQLYFIGRKKAGEQLAAMEMMGVAPMSRVLAPRFVAALIAMPLLAAMFSAVGVMGSWIVGVQIIGVDPGSFWSQMQAGVDIRNDIGNGVIKSMIFGVICAFIALFVGNEATATPEGVSLATTSTVVASSLVVLGFDFMLTGLMFGGF